MEEITKRRKLENLGKNGLLRCSVGNPCHSVNLRQGVGYLATVRLRCQNGTPRVGHDVAFLLCDVAIVQREQILEICFRAPRIRTLII